MPTSKMHADEIDIDEELVRLLLADQFPQWASFSLHQIVSSGTNNALYRLGSDMVVRLPRIPGAVQHIDIERTWLPKLAPKLPVKVPVPLGLGKPTKYFNWSWTIYTWLEGVNPVEGQVENPKQIAEDLANFITALRKIDISGAPLARRGKPLTNQDTQARQAIKELEGMIDIKSAEKIWDKCLRSAVWDKQPVWVHGDLMPANLLVLDGHLSGVCDFEGTGIGDPACDLIPAWNLLPASVRNSFRVNLQIDDATWERGRGWAFSMALIQLPYYKDTNPSMAANARYVINEVLNEK